MIIENWKELVEKESASGAKEMVDSLKKEDNEDATNRELNRELDRLKRETAAKEMVDSLSSWINGAGDEEMKVFVSQLLNSTHRTLQQKLFGLFINYSYELAETENYDLRNKHAREISQKITELLGEYGKDIPTI